MTVRRQLWRSPYRLGNLLGFSRHHTAMGSLSQTVNTAKLVARRESWWSGKPSTSQMLSVKHGFCKLTSTSLYEWCVGGKIKCKECGFSDRTSCKGANDWHPVLQKGSSTVSKLVNQAGTNHWHPAIIQAQEPKTNRSPGVRGQTSAFQSQQWREKVQYWWWVQIPLTWTIRYILFSRQVSLLAWSPWIKNWDSISI